MQRSLKIVWGLGCRAEALVLRVLCWEKGKKGFGPKEGLRGLHIRVPHTCSLRAFKQVPVYGSAQKTLVTLTP